MFPLPLLTVDRSLNTFVIPYYYHKVAKFQQNRMIKNIQNLNFLTKNLFTMLTISENILSAIVKEVLHVKQ